jgi:hypothetical protein
MGVRITMPESTVEIVLGRTTEQDLLLDMGPPLRKFWKEDDRLERMWGARRGPEEISGCKYLAISGRCLMTGFWNYFQHGLDLLVLDGLVMKVVVHSNIVSVPSLWKRWI